MATEKLKQAVVSTGIDDCADFELSPKTYRVKQKTRTLREDEPGVRAATLGDENKDKPTKCILVAGDYLGDTPMESWVNGVINYVMGVNWKDNFRFKWVEDGVPYDWTKVHTLNYQDGYMIDYNLVVVYIPVYQPSMLIHIDGHFPEVDEYYYMCRAKKVKEQKQLKMFGRDMTGKGVKWTLLLTGSGSGTEEHIAKHMNDLKSYNGKTIVFPDPDMVFGLHDEVGGEQIYNSNQEGFAAMLNIK